MQLEAMQSSAVAGFQEALARSSSGEPSTKEVRDKIQTQSDRIQELQSSRVAALAMSCQVDELLWLPPVHSRPPPAARLKLSTQTRNARSRA